MLLQPISRSSIDSIIRAAYGLIIRERRRYFRCPIDVRIVAHRRTEAAWVGRTVNVSEDGLCIAAPVQLTPGDLVELEFKLPQSSLEIGAEARVQWCNQTGRAGLRFLRLEHDARSDLQHWLTEQLNKILKPTLARVDLNRTHQETFLAKLY
ncbi:MAG TPA: PilZ domain-containing protein [Terriglobales bacterium]|nr:PilZ domain-containing protein [Terriglobales bacterium]